jgi:hypothetical protein
MVLPDHAHDSAITEKHGSIHENQGLVRPLAARSSAEVVGVEAS